MRNKKSIFFMIISVLLTSVFTVESLAWGPERSTYTSENPADHAVFNSITDNAAVGDERDFVRIVEKDTHGIYVSELEIEPNKQYEVYIYYHNDASETYNDSTHNYIGVARDVRLSSSFPNELAKGERQAVTGKITSSTTDPEAVWDEAYVTAKEAMTLHYVEGSARIYNGWETNESALATSLFSAEGTFLGLNELNGVILGCANYSGQVVYTIQTEAVNEETPIMQGIQTPKTFIKSSKLGVAIVVTLAVGIGIFIGKKIC